MLAGPVWRFHHDGVSHAEWGPATLESALSALRTERLSCIQSGVQEWAAVGCARSQKMVAGAGRIPTLCPVPSVAGTGGAVASCGWRPSV